LTTPKKHSTFKDTKPMKAGAQIWRKKASEDVKNERINATATIADVVTTDMQQNLPGTSMRLCFVFTEYLSRQQK
jgi:hypothetical protein